MGRSPARSVKGQIIERDNLCAISRARTNQTFVALIMLAAHTFSLGFQGVALAPQPKVMMAEGMAPDFADKPWTSGEIKDTAGLAALAKELNPIVANDGVFWIAKEEFFKYFKTIYLCAKDMSEFLID